MSEDELKAPGPLVSITDVSGLGALSRSAIASLQKAIATLYRPTAIRKEGGARIEFMSREIIYIAKARAETILAQPTNQLEKLRSLDDLKDTTSLERPGSCRDRGAAAAR